MRKSARYVLLTLALCTALTACSSKSTESKKDKKTKNEATTEASEEKSEKSEKSTKKSKDEKATDEQTTTSEKATKSSKKSDKTTATVDDYVSVEIAEPEEYSIETVSLEVVESEYADSKKALKAVLKFTALKDDSDTVSLAYDIYAFQNGLSLDDEYTDHETRSTESRKELKKGESVEVPYYFSLKDNTDVVIAATELYDGIVYADVYVNEERGLMPSDKPTGKVEVVETATHKANKNNVTTIELNVSNDSENVEYIDSLFGVMAFQNGVSLTSSYDQEYNSPYDLVLPGYDFTWTYGFKMLDETDPVYIISTADGKDEIVTCKYNGTKGEEANTSITEDSVKYLGHEIKNVDNKNILVIYYEYTNGTEAYSSFNYKYFTIKAKQGENYLSSSYKELNIADAIDYSSDIMKGYTKKVYLEYELTDTTSDVILTLEPWYDSTEETVTQEIKLQ